MADVVSEIRAFNRFYTRRIGLLDEHLKSSPFTLAESRVLFEIARAGSASAAEVARTLRIDPGFLSRILYKLTDAGLVSSIPDPQDRRRNSTALTPEGEAAFASINRAAEATVAEDLLAPLDPAQQEALVGAMHTIRRLLDDEPSREPIVLRPHRLGELGWLIHRQGVLYNRQFGWSIEFEALIARLYSDFQHMPADPPRDLWIADRGGRVVGSVHVTPSEGRPGVAQLRMLYVEPEERGAGIGTLLVEQCIAFARASGYRRMRLWTQSVLTAARRIYAAAGFECVESAPHHSFGHDLVGEYWEKAL